MLFAILLFAVAVVAAPIPWVPYKLRYPMSRQYEYDVGVPVYPDQRPIENGNPVMLINRRSPTNWSGLWQFQNPSSGGLLQIRVWDGRDKAKPMCLDSGLDPRDGTKAKVWQCYDGAWQQSWKYENGRIRLASRNLCLDLPDGNASNDLQLWTCYDGNTNQQFLAETPDFQ